MDLAPMAFAIPYYRNRSTCARRSTLCAPRPTGTGSCSWSTTRDQRPRWGVRILGGGPDVPVRPLRSEQRTHRLSIPVTYLGATY
jgi:hypothetical protein